MTEEDKEEEVIEEIEKEAEDKTSKDNQGKLIIIRLHNLKKDIHLHARQKMHSLWSDDLDRIWVELSSDIIDDDKFIKVKSELEEFDKELSKYLINGGFQDTEPEGWAKVDKDIKIKRDMQKKVLTNKEIYLGRLTTQLGKGTKFSKKEKKKID
jgi:hypothetical protein